MQRGNHGRGKRHDNLIDVKRFVVEWIPSDTC